LLLMLVLARGASQYRSTPLHLAAENGRVEAIKTLVELKANLEVRGVVCPMPLKLMYVLLYSWELMMRFAGFCVTVPSAANRGTARRFTGLR